jgi:hypothetical protein
MMERNMLDTNAKPKWVQRTKWVELDGAEREGVYVRTGNLSDADELEALGREALHVAAEWRREIAERVPTPPTYRVFTFDCQGRDREIATWLQHPWALVRIGKGTSVAFLVKERNTSGSYEYAAWIVSAEKNVSGRLRWKRRFEGSTTVEQRDIIHVFPFPLPHSPSLGDLELARLKYVRTTRAGRAP